MLVEHKGFVLRVDWDQEQTNSSFLAERERERGNSKCDNRRIADTSPLRLIYVFFFFFPLFVRSRFSGERWTVARTTIFDISRNPRVSSTKFAQLQSISVILWFIEYQEIERERDWIIQRERDRMIEEQS